MIKLDANESPFDLSEDLKAKIISKIEEVNFNVYPDPDSEVVKEKFGDYLGVSKSHISIGNGSDELLGNIISLYLKENDKLQLFARDFGMYTYYAKKRGVKPVYYDRPLDKALDLENFVSAVKDSQAKMLIFSNPNNPTGSVLTKEEILYILDQLPYVKIVLDEAYGEFSEVSLVDEIENHDNLLITRTLSKAMGMASIRVGACISNEENISFLEANKVPYNVSTLSQLCVETILDEKYIRESQEKVKYIVDERNRVFQTLESMGLKDLKAYPSQANFIYMSSPRMEDFVLYLNREGVLIREFPESQFFRITIGLREENDMVLDLIRRFFA